MSVNDTIDPKREITEVPVEVYRDGGGTYIVRASFLGKDFEAADAEEGEALLSLAEKLAAEYRKRSPLEAASSRS